MCNDHRDGELIHLMLGPASDAFGGLVLMKRFIDQMNIRKHLATLNLPQGGSNRDCEPVQIIESFWLDIWTRASRYIHCNWLH